MSQHIELIPSPVLFIKSIAEQGYSLSTALADLIDNSISANATRIEILFDKKSKPFNIIIADNGNGMSESELQDNMRFPSKDLEIVRNDSDLGRFGLGLKTASFSQARRFSLVSKKEKDDLFAGRTWDVEYLQANGWALIINTESEVKEIIQKYALNDKNFHNSEEAFSLKTIIIWEGLFKLEKEAISSQEIEDEFNEIRNHLSLIFHRYIEAASLVIRLNNELIIGFNPFPLNVLDVQKMNENHWKNDNDYVTFQGIILPKRAIEESKSENSSWTIAKKSLVDMEGIYVYRNNRLIHSGGWLRTRQKTNVLQLARIRIDISNKNDDLFHLNVAKSSLKIPYFLKRAMIETLRWIEIQSIKEYRDRVTSEIVIKSKDLDIGLQLINKVITSNGPVLKVNDTFFLLQQIFAESDEKIKQKLRMLIHLMEVKLNEVWQVELPTITIDDGLGIEIQTKVQNMVSYLSQSDFSNEEIIKWLSINIGNTSQHLTLYKLITQK